MGISNSDLGCCVLNHRSKCLTHLLPQRVTVTNQLNQLVCADERKCFSLSLKAKAKAILTLNLSVFKKNKEYIPKSNIILKILSMPLFPG